MTTTSSSSCPRYGPKASPMIRQHLRRSAPLLLSFAFLTACSDAKAPTAPPAAATPATPATPAPPATPTSGTLAFDVVTTGADVDADGFLLSVDGGAAQ